jgi:hypothetical protein
MAHNQARVAGRRAIDRIVVHIVPHDLGRKEALGAQCRQRRRSVGHACRSDVAAPGREIEPDARISGTEALLEHVDYVGNLPLGLQVRQRLRQREVLLRGKNGSLLRFERRELPRRRRTSRSSTRATC